MATLCFWLKKGKEKSQNTSLWPPGNTRGEGKRMKGRRRKDLLIQGFRVVATILWPYDGLMEEALEFPGSSLRQLATKCKQVYTE